MLAGVLLHDVEPALFVDRGNHMRADRKGPIAKVQKPLAVLLAAGNNRVADAADVARLAALVRKEHRPVKLDAIRAAARFAGGHDRLAGKKHAVL